MPEASSMNCWKLFQSSQQQEQELKIHPIKSHFIDDAIFIAWFVCVSCADRTDAMLPMSIFLLAIHLKCCSQSFILNQTRRSTSRTNATNQVISNLIKTNATKWNEMKCNQIRSNPLRRNTGRCNARKCNQRQWMFREYDCICGMKWKNLEFNEMSANTVRWNETESSEIKRNEMKRHRNKSKKGWTIGELKSKRTIIFGCRTWRKSHSREKYLWWVV
jgi:hypothetical protein